MTLKSLPSSLSLGAHNTEEVWQLSWHISLSVFERTIDRLHVTMTEDIMQRCSIVFERCSVDIEHGCSCLAGQLYSLPASAYVMRETDDVILTQFHFELVSAIRRHCPHVIRCFKIELEIVADQLSHGKYGARYTV